jgi:hypothetical protein
MQVTSLSKNKTYRRLKKSWMQVTSLSKTYRRLKKSCMQVTSLSKNSLALGCAVETICGKSIRTGFPSSANTTHPHYMTISRKRHQKRVSQISVLGLMAATSFSIRMEFMLKLAYF